MKQRRHAWSLNFLPRLSKRYLDKTVQSMQSMSEENEERNLDRILRDNYIIINTGFARCITLSLFSAMWSSHQRVSFPSRFIFRGCGAIWLEVSDRRPVAFTNLPLPIPLHPLTTMVFSHFRVRAHVAQHSKHANKSEHSMPRVDSIAPYL